MFVVVETQVVCEGEGHGSGTPKQGSSCGRMLERNVSRHQEEARNGTTEERWVTES